MLLFAIAVLSGCAMPLNRSGSNSAKEKADLLSASAAFTIPTIGNPDKKDAELTPRERKQIQDALAETLSFCKPILSEFEDRSYHQAHRSFWLAMSGLLAGSVIGPALTAANATKNAAWIAGLSGWGGAIGFASQTYQTTGLSGSAIATTRNTIITNVMEQIKIATSGKSTYGDRSDAIMQARADCILYVIAVPSVPTQK
jgi:hypothetical protein